MSNEDEVTYTTKQKIVIVICLILLVLSFWILIAYAKWLDEYISSEEFALKYQNVQENASKKE